MTPTTMTPTMDVTRARSSRSRASHRMSTALREHVPVGRRLIDHTRRGPMQADLILAGSAMPDADRPLAVLFEIAPDVPLIGKRDVTAAGHYAAIACEPG